MPHSWIGHDARPCLWMAAGLIDYKLCDRDFDCEHCPLDAALRGDSRLVGPAPHHTGGRPPANLFPPDRRYSTGHTWLQPFESGNGSTACIGLDAFAASMLGSLVDVRITATADSLRRGEPFSELRLDSGSLSLTLPIKARSAEGNPRLRDKPDLALTAPYGDGWLAALTDVDAVELDDLMSADEALEQARQDLRLFRRRVALQMLADTSDLGHCLADGGEPLTDLRQMLGAPRLCTLLQQLLH